MIRPHRISQLLLGIAAVTLITVGCGDKKSDVTSPTPVDQVDLSAIQANTLIETSPQLVIIDVASFAEYWDVHISGAINYSIGNGEFQRMIPTLDNQVTYLVYGHDSLNSQLAVDEMTAAGFTNVHRLAESLSVWINEGYPVVVPEPS